MLDYESERGFELGQLESWVATDMTRRHDKSRVARSLEWCQKSVSKTVGIAMKISFQPMGSVPSPKNWAVKTGKTRRSLRLCLYTRNRHFL